MPLRPIALSLLLVAVVVAAWWLWRAQASEPMAGFRDFPWTYIAEPGADPARVVVCRGAITGPPSTTDGTGATAWPAYVHPEAAVVPLIGGRPCIIPLITEAGGSRTPVIPGLGRPLTRPEIDKLVRYQTDEGRARMDAFRKEMVR